MRLFALIICFVFAGIRSQSLVADGLQEELNQGGFASGASLFIRVFKTERVLEVWLKKSGRFALFKMYPICAYSGDLGPKLREGDRQSPEGFYRIGPKQLHPGSRFHRAFNLGYPNAYDRSHGRTGSFLMVHGNCVSIGCYAMTDPGIDQIYQLAEAALANGQSAFQVHIFPFRFDAPYAPRFDGHRWASFWDNLREGYALFEQTRRVPNIRVRNGRYEFR